MNLAYLHGCISKGSGFRPIVSIDLENETTLLGIFSNFLYNHTTQRLLFNVRPLVLDIVMASISHMQVGVTSSVIYSNYLMIIIFPSYSQDNCLTDFQIRRGI